VGEQLHRRQLLQQSRRRYRGLLWRLLWRYGRRRQCLLLWLWVRGLIRLLRLLRETISVMLLLLWLLMLLWMLLLREASHVLLLLLLLGVVLPCVWL